MELVKQSQSKRHINSETSSALEYPMQHSDINVAVVSITGRYPEKGYAVNDRCSELAYVQSGHGTVSFQNGDQVKVTTGDAILLEPTEAYAWEGVDLTLIISSTPAWTPDQHRTVE